MRQLVLLAIVAALAAAAPIYDLTTQTTSGISAGGFFGVQYQIAHSAKIRAAGIIAGGPYYCAQGSLLTATECMSDPLSINIGSLDSIMNISAALGDIDPVSHIKNHAVMLFSGTIDSIVNHGTMELLALQYAELGVRDLVTYFNYTAEHAWITNDYGNACSYVGTPYMNNCGLDFSGEFFRFAWNHMKLSFNEHRGTFNASNLISFSQVAFGADALFNSLDTTGYIYQPAKCQPGAVGSTNCHVHVNFHGCTQGASSIGTQYVSNSGLNEWAEANNIVIVYPQVTSNDLQDNPNGCFDWWGYAGSNYASKQGVQMVFIESIVAYLAANGTLPAAPAGKK
jgi:poly(3-hydroxybutyrate) depolymerase